MLQGLATKQCRSSRTAAWAIRRPIDHRLQSGYATLRRLRKLCLRLSLVDSGVGAGDQGSADSAGNISLARLVKQGVVEDSGFVSRVWVMIRVWVKVGAMFRVRDRVQVQG